MCSDACRTSVETIASARLDAWYDLRTHSDAQGATTADPRHRAELEAWRVPEVEAALLRRGDDGSSDDHDRAGAEPDSPARTPPSPTAVTLTVEGMRCAGCAWLVERLLASVPGVSAATVDFPLRRAEVRFDIRATRVHTLLETLAKAGYRATPYTVHAEEAAIESERRARIRGLGISALFGMQVMLLSIALYASEWYGGMEAGFEQLFRWLAMMLTVPVLVWPGRAFFTGAVAALRNRSLTMDVPVALGLTIAFAGSAFATVTGEGEVWFDSVVMFVTLLSAARYLELLARRRATATIRALARSAPLVATRVRAGASDGGDGTSPAGCDAACHGNTGDDGNAASAGDAGDTAGDGSNRDDPDTERIPAAALRPGDRVRVRPGEVVPADGTIRSGHSAFDESLLTGESNPVSRSAGDRVLAGSVNGSGVVEVEVACAGDDTVLGGVLHRAGHAARERPAIAHLADRAAAWFIGAVLVLATGVAVAWLLHDPSRMIPVLVSVLVVTCPCALSLATPAAMTAALGALARAGLIATRANAVERLALATHCLADKTGTLTEGRFRLRSVTAFAGVSGSRCLALAAALERFATHPAAAALVAAADGDGREVGIGDEAGPGNEAEIGAKGEPGAGRKDDKAPVIEPMATARAKGDEHAIARTDAPEAAACKTNLGGLKVEEADTHTGGVTGGIDGVHYAVGSPEFVVRACGLDPGTFGIDGARNEPCTSFPECRTPEVAEPVAASAGAGAPGLIEASPSLHSNQVRATSWERGHLARSGRRPAMDDPRKARDSSSGQACPRMGEAGDARAPRKGTTCLVGPKRSPAGPSAPAPGIPGTPGNDDGATHVFLAHDGAPLARFTLADTLRADARTLVDGLRRRGIETTIASGDSAAAVDLAARALGVSHHLAGLSPEDKLKEAARLAASGERVLMLGDGVNDTPALAGAHVSVAMGRGAAAAAARADAVLIGNDPGRLLAALDIARRARRIVKQNLAWALGYNLVALPLAAAGAVPPWAAAVGMSLSSLAVAGNALRVSRGRDPDGR